MLGNTQLLQTMTVLGAAYVCVACADCPTTMWVKWPTGWYPSVAGE